MHPLKSNLIFWLTGFYIVGYGLLYALAGYSVAAYVLAAILFGLGIVVFIDWFSTMVEAIKSGGREGDAILAFCICILALYLVHTRLWAVFRLGVGSPEWTETSPIGQFAAVWLTIAFTGILVASGTQNGDIPRSNLIRLTIAGFVAGCGVGALVVYAVLSSSPGVDGARELGRVVNPVRSNFPTLTCDAPERPQLVNAYCRSRMGALKP